jgi:hypothetical protein
MTPGPGRFRLLLVLLVTAGGRCAAPPARAAAGWLDQHAAGHFQLRADFPLPPHADLIAELTQLEQDLTRTLEIGPIDQPIHLLLFRDQNSYQRYVDRYFRGAPARRALFLKGSGPGWVLAYQNPDFAVDVRHESTHALLHSRLPIVPLWLDEGLAEYYEVPAEQRAYENPHLSPTRWAARFYRVRPLSELEELHDVSQMGPADYRAAWAWVHFLLHGPPEGRQTLVRYLHDLRRNLPAGRLYDRLELALPNLEQEYLRHFRNWRK